MNWIIRPIDIMNSKGIIVIFAVVIVVAAVAVVALTMNGGSNQSNNNAPEPEKFDPTEKTVDLGGVVKVFGNVNGDSVIDNTDLEYLKQIVDGKQAKTEFSDVNQDGKVDNSDVTQLQDMLNRKDGTVVFYIGGDDTVAKVEWPLNTFVVLTNSPQLMAVAVGLSYPGILAYTKEDPVVFKSFEGAKVIADGGLSDFENLTSNGIPDAVLVKETTELTDDLKLIYDKAGIDIIRTASLDGFESSSSALTIGYLVNKETQSQKYCKWCSDFLNDVSTKVASIKKEDRHTALIMYGAKAVGGTTGSGQPYNEALEAAGAISIADFENYRTLTADNKDWLLNYHNEYFIRIYTMGYSIDDAARTTVYNKYAQLVDQTDAYKAGHYCVIDFTLPQTLRIAYIAEFMYPEVFGAGYGDSWHQKLLDLEGIDYKVNGQFLWTPEKAAA